MSENIDNPNLAGQSTSSLVDLWASVVQQSAENIATLQKNSEAGDDSRGWRRKWFDLLDQQTDTYLRSPEFLRLLKAHIDALAVAKRLHDSQTQQETKSDPGSESLSDDVRAMRHSLARLQSQQAVSEELQRAIQPDIGGPASGSPRESKPSPEKTRGVTPCDVVYREGTLKLLRYRNKTVRFAEPILICFALVNRPYILDLQEKRSVVRRLLDRGFDVYLIDWGVPGKEERNLQLEDYVSLFMANVVDVVCVQAGTSQLNLLGYCMGGTMSTMFTALYPHRVRNLILMAAPIRFSEEDEGLLNLWARQEYFDVDRLIDAFGNCPGEFLQFVFQLMKPVQNFAEKQLTFCENLDDREFLENFCTLERWANDSIPVAGETFRHYVKSLYQQNQLVKGQLRLAGEAIRLDAITCPVLLLVAEKDHLVPPSSTLALKQYVGSKEVESLTINAGHIGLAVSTKSHRDLWPQAADWIASHSTEI